MKLLRLAVAAAALMGLAAAQDNAEIVVTASRYVSNDGDSGIVAVIPHVTLKRRADNLVTTVRVICDTRDATLRDQEIRQTLRDMIRTAAGSGGTIMLSVGDSILVPFDETMIEKAIMPEGRPDTSYAGVVVKTAVKADDTYDGAMARVLAFVAATPKTGRTEILADTRWDLTLIGPENNRDELIGLIAADAKKTAALFGGGFAVEVDGLHNPIAWYQSGPLDLYIPYTLNTSGTGAP
ncbi:MAG: hypothetical protein QM698_01795 [Micropepsaceae bacterium]